MHRIRGRSAGGLEESGVREGDVRRHDWEDEESDTPARGERNGAFYSAFRVHAGPSVVFAVVALLTCGLVVLNSQELHDTGAAYTEASQSNDDAQAEAKQLRRQLKNSMALVDNLQAELQHATDTEAEKYAGDKADRTAAYFELESTLHKTRAEKTKLVRENKQLQRKVEKFESANSGAAAQGMLTDGGWCVCRSTVPPNQLAIAGIETD